MNGWTKAFGIVILFAAAVFLFAVAMAKTDGMAIASISVDTFLADETYKKCTELAGGLVAVGGICSIAAGSKYKSAFVCVLGALVALIGVSFLMMATGNIDFSEKNVDIFLGALFGITALVGISYATSRKSVFGFIIFVILFLLAIVFKGENFDGKIIAFAGHGFPLYCFNSEMFMPILGMLIAFFVGVYFIVCSMRDTRDAKKKAAAAAEAAEETAEEAPAEETAEETPAEEVAAEEAPAEEAPAEAAAVAAEEVPAEETAEEAPAEPAEETPAETAVEEAPAEETAEEAPAEVVEETPAETAVEETPAETAVEETPAETAVEEAPAEAVEETPAETAVEEAPAEAVEEAPAEPAVEEAPVEEAPAEEAPSEEVAAAVAVGVATEAASAEEEVPALPAIKSSQDAAAAAAAVKAENEERLSDEAAEDGENIPEEEAPAEEDEEMLSLEDLGLEPDTPETFVRRAAWNKGLRCRRDYGKHKIPVAFVKGKVAVFVDKGEPVTSKDEVLAKEGWTVFHFPEADIVDGAAEAEIVAKAVKENLKASKKKRKTTRR